MCTHRVSVNLLFIHSCFRSTQGILFSLDWLFIAQFSALRGFAVTALFSLVI